jgi:cytochrome c oxidase subunit 1
MLGSVPVDIHLHDTYFIVAHFHYVLFGGSVFGIYAGIYHWFPKMTGKMLNEFWGKVHFFLTFVGFNLCFLPMHLLGLQGMPRRVSQYDPQFASINVICTIGAFLLAISTFPFLFNAIFSWIKGEKATDNPWNGLTLEWTTSSPPIVENWHGDPVLTTGPYDYGMEYAHEADLLAEPSA